MTMTTSSTVTIRALTPLSPRFYCVFLLVHTLQIAFLCFAFLFIFFSCINALSVSLLRFYMTLLYFGRFSSFLSVYYEYATIPIQWRFARIVSVYACLFFFSFHFFYIYILFCVHRLFFFCFWFLHHLLFFFQFFFYFLYAVCESMSCCVLMLFIPGV